MRTFSVFLVCICLLLAACKSAGASKNLLLGTWVTADNPIPAGCMSKYVFKEKTMYLEDPDMPKGAHPSKRTVNIIYGGGPTQPNLVVVENPATMVTDDWIFSDPTHATSGALAQCHYVKQ